jgi:hypothetical protein
MKRCPKCKSLMPDDVSKCIHCGHDATNGSLTNKAAAPASAPAQPTFTEHLNADTLPEKVRKQKRQGLALVALGLIIQILLFVYTVPVLLFIGMVLCAVGIGYYARSLGRTWVWGTICVWPIVGSVVGLVLLAVMKPPQLENSQPKVMTAARLKWGWLLYVIVLWYVPLQVYLTDGLTCVSLPNKQFPSLILVEGFGCGMAAFNTLALGFLAAIVCLHASWRAIKTFGMRLSAPWLALRAVVTLLSLLYAFSAFSTLKMASEIVEARSTQELSKLRVGMTRQSVERVILETNASLIPPAEDTSGRSSTKEKAEYQKVRDAMSRVEQGQSVKFSDLKFHRALFNENLYSLDRIAGPKSSASRAVFVRSCCQIMYRWTRYDLFAEYDQDDHLLSARYLKSEHEDGEDRSCVVLLTIPASADKQYPCQRPPVGGQTKLASDMPVAAPSRHVPIDG